MRLLDDSVRPKQALLGRWVNLKSVDAFGFLKDTMVPHLPLVPTVSTLTGVING